MNKFHRAFLPSSHIWQSHHGPIETTGRRPIGPKHLSSYTVVGKSEMGVLNDAMPIAIGLRVKN